MKCILSATVILTLIVDACYASDSPLLTEDFNDGQSQGWTFLNVSQVIVDDYLRMSSGSWGDDTRAIFHNDTWNNYVFEVDLRIENSAGSSWPASLLFHVKEASSGLDNGKYYQFNVGPTLLQFVKVDHSAGNAGSLVQVARSTTTGVWHHVRLEIEGTTATALINGQQVLTYNGFTDFLSGGIGLKTINSASINYDNVLVTLPFKPTLAIRTSQVELSWDTIANRTYQLQ